MVLNQSENLRFAKTKLFSFVSLHVRVEMLLVQTLLKQPVWLLQLTAELHSVGIV